MVGGLGGWWAGVSGQVGGWACRLWDLGPGVLGSGPAGQDRTSFDDRLFRNAWLTALTKIANSGKRFARGVSCVQQEAWLVLCSESSS